MKHFTIDTAPPMSNGLMIAALSGPQDVAQSATTALKHLMQQDRVVTFAQADPDGLFIYNTFTPNLKRNKKNGLVTIVWPRLELHHTGPGDEPGPVFLAGWRPHIGMRELVQDLVLQRRISKCDVWPFVFGHERAIAVGSWQYVVRFKLVTKTTLPDKLSL